MELSQLYRPEVGEIRSDLAARYVDSGGDKWKSPFFAANLSTCLFGFFCPMCASARARSLYDGSNCCFNLFVSNNTVLTRWMLRTGYGIRGNWVEDFVVGCTPILCNLSAGQVLSEAMMRGPSSVGGSHRNTDLWIHSSIDTNPNRVQDTTIASTTNPAMRRLLHYFSVLCGWDFQAWLFGCLCPCCQIGLNLERAYGLPFWMGCCCGTPCFARSTIRYTYRIRPYSCEDGDPSHGANLSSILPCCLRDLASIGSGGGGMGGGVGTRTGGLCTPVLSSAGDDWYEDCCCPAATCCFAYASPCPLPCTWCLGACCLAPYMSVYALETKCRGPSGDGIGYLPSLRMEGYGGQRPAITEEERSTASVNTYAASIQQQNHHQQHQQQQQQQYRGNNPSSSSSNSSSRSGGSAMSGLGLGLGFNQGLGLGLGAGSGSGAGATTSTGTGGVRLRARSVEEEWKQQQEQQQNQQQNQQCGGSGGYSPPSPRLAVLPSRTTTTTVTATTTTAAAAGAPSGVAVNAAAAAASSGPVAPAGGAGAISGAGAAIGVGGGGKDEGEEGEGGEEEDSSEICSLLGGSNSGPHQQPQPQPQPQQQLQLQQTSGASSQAGAMEARRDLV